MAGFNDANREYFGGTLGFRCVDLSAGWARLEVENRTPLMNPVGVMHGGASFGLADSAVAAALMTIYGVGTHALLTIEMKINYLEPIPAGQAEWRTALQDLADADAPAVLVTLINDEGWGKLVVSGEAVVGALDDKRRHTAAVSSARSLLASADAGVRLLKSEEDGAALVERGVLGAA